MFLINRNIKSALISVLLIIIGYNTSNGQMYIEWERNYGGSASDIPAFIINTLDSGYLVGVTTTSNDSDVVNNYGGGDVWLVKLDSIGQIEWSKNYGGTMADLPVQGMQLQDSSYAILIGSNSSNIDMNSNNGGLDYGLIKISKSGSVLWTNNYGGSDGDVAHDFSQLSDGSFVIAGMSSSNDFDVSTNFGANDYWVIRVDSTGNLMWEKTFGTSTQDRCYSVDILSDKYIVVGGQWFVTSFNQQYNVILMDTSGAFIWQQTYGGTSGDHMHTLQVKDSDEILLTGTSYSDDFDVSSNYGNGDIWVVSIDSLGNIKWENNYGGSDDELAFGGNFINLSNNTFINVAESKSSDIHVPTNYGDWDAFVWECDDLGNLLWSRSFGGSDYEEAVDIKYTHDGGAIFTARSESNDIDVSNNYGNSDAWVVKLAPCPTIAQGYDSITICQGDSVFIGGSWRDTSGTYLDTVASVLGCDSVNSINLSVIQYTYNNNNVISTCDSYTIGNSTYNVDGTYIDTLFGASVSGCDSIVTTYLTLEYGTTYSQNVNLCYGDTFYFNSHAYSNWGIFKDTLVGQAYNGCDSIVTTNITVTPSLYIQYATICDGNVFTVGSSNYTISGTYVDTLTTTNNCDSILTTYLTVLAPQTTLNVSICLGDTFSVGDNDYTISGTYLDILTSNFGCDSVVTTNLTVLNTSFTTYDTICYGQSIIVGGNTYSTSGIYIDNLIANSGCDSTIITHLLVKDSINTGITTTIDSLIANATNVSYQWMDCDAMVILAGEVNKVFFPTIAGKYAVIITEGICIDTSNCVLSYPSGVTHHKNSNSYQIYPNPTTKSFTVHSPEQGQFTVTDLRGRQVATGELNKEMQLDAPAGIYFVSHGNQTLKLVLTK